MIIVIVRTLNEADHIDRFCTRYGFADKIFVADGGSEDGTPEMAQRYDNVEVREFTERIETPDGKFMNPESKHSNFLIDWAIQAGAEWIIYDDCDCAPNKLLHRDAREILANAGQPAVLVRRLHLWLKTQYFPRMSGEGSLWAWKPGEVHIYGEERSHLGIQIRGIPDEAENIEPPYCLLHDTFPTEQAVEEKLQRYDAWGMPQQHPLKWIYAPPEPLPEWAV